MAGKYTVISTSTEIAGHDSGGISLFAADRSETDLLTKGDNWRPVIGIVEKRGRGETDFP